MSVQVGEATVDAGCREFYATELRWLRVSVSTFLEYTALAVRTAQELSFE